MSCLIHYVVQLKELRANLGSAEKEIVALKKSINANKAPSGQQQGDVLTRRLQVIKTQKEATQHRAEVAEAKLLTTTSQLSEMTKSHDALEKEKVVLEKKISRLEKEKEKLTQKDISSKNPPTNESSLKHSSSSGNKRKGGDDIAASPLDSDKSIGVMKVLVLSIVIALISLYMGTIIGPMS